MLDIFEDLGIDGRPVHVKMDLRKRVGAWTVVMHMWLV
jgi:hypothetical protein